MKKEVTIFEESDKNDKYSGKSSFISQQCAVCNTNHDYKFKGRTIQCTCGAWLVEGVKGRLRRVG